MIVISTPPPFSDQPAPSGSSLKLKLPMAHEVLGITQIYMQPIRRAQN